MTNRIHSPQMKYHVDKKKAFQVYIRVRPSKQSERLQCQKFQRPQNVVTVQGSKILVADPDSVTANQNGYFTKQYEFHQVFDNEASNQTIYDEAYLRGFTNKFDDRKSTTVLAYGQTGAGKTHTIFGSEQDGLIYKILETLMSQQHQQYKMSYLEIYNEKVRDLLNSSTTFDAPPQIIDNGKTNVIVQGLHWVDLNNMDEALDWLLRGSLKRATSETQHNVQSSRSHALIQITLKKNDAQLIVIDLAGSERNSNSIKLTSTLQHEGSNINKSLLALTNCIKILSDQKNLNQHIPYRDSKLTRLLKASLMGQTNTLMIACISPTWLTYDETINTLAYAQRAGMIKSKLVSYTSKECLQKIHISSDQKHSTQNQQQTHREDEYYSQKRRMRSGEKNFVELNKQTLSRAYPKSKSPNMQDYHIKRQFHSAKTPRTQHFATKSLQKSSLDLSQIQQISTDLLNSSSVMDLLSTIEEGFKAQQKTCHTEISLEQQKKAISLKTLSAERDKFLMFKKMLGNVYKTISALNNKDDRLRRVDLLRTQLLNEINQLLQEFKLHKWILQSAEDKKLKSTVNFAQHYLYKVRSTTATPLRKKSYGFQF